MPVLTLLVAGQPGKAENVKRPEDPLPELAVKLDKAPVFEVGRPARATLGKQSASLLAASSARVDTSDDLVADVGIDGDRLRMAEYRIGTLNPARYL